MSPVVYPPLEKQHIRVFMLPEDTPVRPLVPVEIEKCLATVGQVKVVPLEALPRNIVVNSCRACCGSNIEALHFVEYHECMTMPAAAPTISKRHTVAWTAKPGNRFSTAWL
jgi:hypothetical protein